MRFLLDTNVLSENATKIPHPRVAAWLSSLIVTETYLSVITLAEIAKGIEVSRDPGVQARLERWLTDVKTAFASQLLGIDDAIAELGGRIEGRCQRAGRPGKTADAFIAATAELHGLVVATRNVKDFEVWGGPVFNPWTDA